MRHFLSVHCAMNNNSNNNNHNNSNTQQNSISFVETDATLNHLINECSKLAQNVYKSRHEWVKNVINRELCKNSNLFLFISILFYSFIYMYTLFIFNLVIMLPTVHTQWRRQKILVNINIVTRKTMGCAIYQVFIAHERN